MRPFFSNEGTPSADTFAAMSAAMPLTASTSAELNFAAISVTDILGLDSAHEDRSGAGEHASILESSGFEIHTRLNLRCAYDNETSFWQSLD
jgi:hypothetical protein